MSVAVRDHFSKQHQHDLEVFLKDLLGPQDQVFLICFGNHVRLVSDLSKSGTDVYPAWKEFHHDIGRYPELGPEEERELGTALFTIPSTIPLQRSLPKPMAGGRCWCSAMARTNSSSHDHDDDHRSGAERECAGLQPFATRKRSTANSPRGKSLRDQRDETASLKKPAEPRSMPRRPTAYVFQQILEELRTSYELAIYPTSPMKDDSFRRS